MSDNVWRATVLSVDPLNIYEAANLDRDKPSSVRIMSPAFLAGESSGGYNSTTGEMMTWSDWANLEMTLGAASSSPGLDYIPLNLGWRYIYNFITKEFDVYNEEGYRVRHLTDVTSVGDLSISYEVHKNRNFIVILSEKEGAEVDEKRALFIFPVRLVPTYVWGVEPDLVSYGLQNTVPAVYEKGLYFGHVRYFNFDGGEYAPNPQPNVGIEIEYFGTGIRNSINFDKNLWHNYMYLSGYDPIVTEKVLKNMGVTEVELNLRLPKLSLTMYPYLYPCVRDKETLNNRPVYEPWMIYPCPFPYNKRTTDKEIILDEYLFDLSPRWE